MQGDILSPSTSVTYIYDIGSITSVVNDNYTGVIFS